MSAWAGRLEGLRGRQHSPEGAALVCLAALAAAVAAGYFASGRGDARMLAALGAASAALTSFLRWRWGLWIVLVYVTVEGFVTNLLYPWQGSLLFKDAILAGTYAGFVADLRRRRAGWPLPRSVTWPLAVFAGLVAVELFNPRGMGLAVGLVGVRVLLFYIPLFALGYVLAKESGRLDQVAWIIVATSLPVMAYGVFQYFAGPEAYAALGPGFTRGVWIVGPEATEDPIFRPNATFAFTGHFGGYLLFVAIVALALIHTGAPYGGRVFSWAAVVLALVAVVLQSQRTNWVLLPLLALFMYLLNRDLRGALRGGPVLCVGLLGAVSVGGSILANRLPILTGTGKIVDHVRYGALDWLGGLWSQDALLGYGTGTGLGAIRYVTGGYVPGTFENGLAGLLHMFGVGGLVAYAWLFFAVVAAAWTGFGKAAKSERWIASALLGYVVVNMAAVMPIQLPPTNVYVWLAAGILAGLGQRRSLRARDPEHIDDR